MTDSESVFLRSEFGEIVKEQIIKVDGRLATYFSTAAAKIRGSHVSSLTEVDFEDHKSLKIIQEKYEDTSFSFKSFKTQEVRDTLEEINPRKSCGWDRRLPQKLLKNVANGVAPSLTALYNNCIANS